MPEFSNLRLLLNYGVMVTQMVLVHLFLVRIGIVQQNFYCGISLTVEHLTSTQKMGFRLPYPAQVAARLD